MHKEEDNNNRDIAHYVFSGSTTMSGVCITVIALFKVMNVNAKTYADEILGIDTFIFIVSAFLSYLTLRSSHAWKLERYADYFFFAGLTVLLLVGVIIVFSTY